MATRCVAYLWLGQPKWLEDELFIAPEDGNYLHSGIALGYTSDLYKPQNHGLVQAFLRCKKGPTETPQTMNNSTSVCCATLCNNQLQVADFMMSYDIMPKNVSSCHHKVSCTVDSFKSSVGKYLDHKLGSQCRPAL